jgi:uncharacterized protein YdaU (DUF1376 family)
MTTKSSRPLGWYRLPIALQESADFLLLSLAEQGMLFALWKCYWQGGCKGLPCDLRELRAVSKLPPKRLLSSAERLLKFFQKRDGILRCDWLDIEYQGALEFTGAQRDKANKRWKEKGSQGDAQARAAGYAPAHAPAMPGSDRIGSDLLSKSESLRDVSGSPESSGDPPFRQDGRPGNRRFQRNQPDRSDQEYRPVGQQPPTDMGRTEEEWGVQATIENYPLLGIDWQKESRSILSIYWACKYRQLALSEAIEALKGKRQRKEKVENPTAYLIAAMKSADAEERGL